ncbi:hypothetical protein AG4045_018328 [Apium graveolens]|uniref:Protein kinase domain-containing protein n=1 Tax=Apium graveolens TaxID=4045 RepID=A0A6L5B9P0_APIGR|nr:hypothetical protein AG4045_018328 [Apium graveolens]
MSMLMFVYFLLFLFGFLSVSLSQSNATVKCPLDFSIQSRLAEASRHSNDANMQCQLIRQGIGLVQSDYLRRTNSFLISDAFTEPCWQTVQSLFDKYPNHFDIRTVCGIQTHIFTQGCRNLTTRAQYEAKNSKFTLNSVVEACNQSLQIGEACATCTTSISALEPSYERGRNSDYNSDCIYYKCIYAAAFSNSFGPAYKHNVECLFALTFDRSESAKKHGEHLIIACSASGFLIFVMSFAVFWWLWRYKLKMIRSKKDALDSTSSDLDSICGDTTLIKFSFSEVEKATKNFSKLNIIGSGGFGNVYKGVLLDGTEVALKRFKNCSSAGDAGFSHEVEVIASVRHVNLVALRGYCIAMTQFEVIPDRPTPITADVDGMENSFSSTGISSMSSFSTY